MAAIFANGASAAGALDVTTRDSEACCPDAALGMVGCMACNGPVLGVMTCVLSAFLEDELGTVACVAGEVATCTSAALSANMAAMEANCEVAGPSASPAPPPIAADGFCTSCVGEAPMGAMAVLAAVLLGAAATVEETVGPLLGAAGSAIGASLGPGAEETFVASEPVCALVDAVLAGPAVG